MTGTRLSTKHWLLSIWLSMDDVSFATPCMEPPNSALHYIRKLGYDLRWMSSRLLQPRAKAPRMPLLSSEPSYLSIYASLRCNELDHSCRYVTAGFGRAKEVDQNEWKMRAGPDMLFLFTPR